MPSRSAASIVCLRLDVPCEVVQFDNISEAVEAIEVLYQNGCGPQCSRHHLVVWCVAGEASHVVVGRHDPPAVPRDLGHALAAAGYRPVDDIRLRVQHWPTPREFNQPMGPRVMSPETQRLQTEAVEQAGNRVIEPHPGGLAARAAAEHDAARQALARGDVDAEAGHSATASALMDALLAERPIEPVVRTVL